MRPSGQNLMSLDGSVDNRAERTVRSEFEMTLWRESGSRRMLVSRIVHRLDRVQYLKDWLTVLDDLRNWLGLGLEARERA